MKKKYRHLFIDLDDTIYDFAWASRESFRETYEELEYGRFFDSFEQYLTIYEPYNLELWRLYGEGKITKEELNRRRYSYPLEAVGADDRELAETFCKKALARIPTKGQLVPGAKELLEYLKPKYRMHILSNGFKELQSHKIKSAGIVHFFDTIILSEDIGVNKPGLRLFEHALERAGATAEESIMIGDMFETDIAGAHNAGIDQIYYNPGRKKYNGTFSPTYTVTCLLQIKEIL